jgi:peptide/nickel transport system substrate-binding protein
MKKAKEKPMTLKRTAQIVLFSLCIASFVLAGCAPAAKPAEPTAAPKVATFIWTQEFDTLNPLYTNMWFVTVLYPIYTCQAWFFDENNKAFPSMVTEIPSSENGGISADGRTITLKLRKDLKWSDGQPITSKDFMFTYDMIMSDKNAVSSRAPFDMTESVTAPEE